MMRERIIRAAFVAAGLAMATVAGAQIPFTPLNPDPTAANAAFALQNPNGPSGINYQVNYPYPGQCLADNRNGALFPSLTANLCAGGSFAAVPSTGGAVSTRSAGGWADASGATIPFNVLQAYIPDVAGVVTTPKFVWEVLNPPDYSPDTATYPGAHYYEIGLHEAWGFQAVAGLGAFPNPLIGRCSISLLTCDPAVVPPAGCGACNPVYPGAPAVPNGMQWTGLTCNIATGCTCPADAAGAFKTAYCNVGNATVPAPAPAGKIPYGYPIYTPIWGVGQINMGGTLGLNLPAANATNWSQNNYIATWPSISIRATRGTPVVVKWVNEFPDNHVLCPHPEAADWPCAIDRTFMGVKAKIDPATSPVTGTPEQQILFAEGVNKFGSPQQPDNSWVTHLHGGDIPPSTDGFAEKWFGNASTAPLYSPAPKLVSPPFENPSKIALVRPAASFDTYTYPMEQEEATIWFHDHTLGKTHHNVIAGPAGFFPVKDPTKHGAVAGWIPLAVPPLPPATSGLPAGSEYSWLDPVTEKRGGLLGAIPTYDLFLAIQDRAFNDDGSINFSNGLGQPIPLAPLPPLGYTPVTNGVNPQVHPTWVPEYFGDVALVNGVAWPKKTTEPGWYRIRMVDGSDSRCWTIGFQQSTLPPAPGANVSFNVPFYVIANDQGYLASPVLAPGNRFTMCPGERYEILVNFEDLPQTPPGAAANVWMVNNAPAPFPAGISPQKGFAPALNVIMQFAVDPNAGPGIKSCGATVTIAKVVTPIAPAGLTWTPGSATNFATIPAPVGFNAPKGLYQNVCMPKNPAAVPNPFFLNIRPVWPLPVPAPVGTIVRQVYLNEKVDGTTLTPLGMQLNGVPFEYKVTETPKIGTREIWQFVNLTVDAHPMHPHLVKHLVVARQTFNVGKYKAALCGSTTCQPGPAPGNEMQVVPDVSLFLTGTPVLVGPASVESGYKDAVQAPPGQVTTIVADWKAGWQANVAVAPALPTAPGSAGCPTGGTSCAAPPWTYEPVTAGPYVWHCHINSHEDSEMMRTSLVVQ